MNICCIGPSGEDDINSEPCAATIESAVRLCPYSIYNCSTKTGLPDFGTLTIRYMPRERCLELKSLKEYLFCYRNLGIFQENIVNQVLEDVAKAADPVWAEVRGEFRPRGGIGTTVEARWPRPTA